MHAAGIEAVPARTFCVLAIVFAIELCVFIQQVVLPRNIVNLQAGFRDGPIGIVELGGLGEVRDVPGANHEGRLRWQ